MPERAAAVIAGLMILAISIAGCRKAPAPTPPPEPTKPIAESTAGDEAKGTEPVTPLPQRPAEP